MNISTLRKNRLPKKPADSFDWGIKYVKENPIKSLSALTTSFGLATIYAYHFHIEYFPVFDVAALASVVFGAAFVGLILIAALTVALFAPAMQIGALIFDSNRAADSDSKFPQYMIFAFFAFIAWMLYILLASAFDLPTWTVFGVFGVLFLTNVLHKKIFSQASTIRIWEERKHWRSLFIAWRVAHGKRLSNSAKLSWIGLLQIAPLSVFFFMLAKAPGNQGDTIDYFRILHETAMAGLIIHGASAFLIHAWFNPRATPALRLPSVLCSLAVPFVVSFFSGNPSLLWMGVAQATKFGNYHVAEMTVKKNVCAVLSLQDSGNCVPLDGGETFRICRIHVLSGIGVQTYVMLNSESEKASVKQLRSVLVPSSDILSQSIDTGAKFSHLDAVQHFLLKNPARCAPR